MQERVYKTPVRDTNLKQRLTSTMGEHKLSQNVIDEAARESGYAHA